VRPGDHLTTEQDPDDWFTDEDVGEQRTGTYAPLEDWLRAEPGRARPWESLDRRVLAGAAAVLVAAVVIVVVVLATGGKSHPSASTPPTTSSITTTPPRTTPAPTPSRPAVAAPTAPLKAGDTGAQVKVLQRALARLGYSTGKVDGSYGPATQAAVQRFQRAKGLTADGVAGAKTLQALRAALRQAT